jgi:hypothetical protein
MRFFPDDAMTEQYLSRLRKRKVAFGHYSCKNDIGGVTTWLNRMLFCLHNDGVPVVALLHHRGSDIQQSGLLHTLRKAGISVEIKWHSFYTEDNVRGTLVQ